MKRFKKLLCIAFVLTVLFAFFAISASASSAPLQTETAHNLPYVADSYSTLRFSSKILHQPTIQHPEYNIDCPIVFYCYSFADILMQFRLDNSTLPTLLRISSDGSGGSVTVLNRTFNFSSTSSYIPNLLFIVYKGYITCYHRTESFTTFLFDIKYDSSTVPTIASSNQYDQEIAYLVDPSYHTRLADLGTESYSGAYTAGQLAGSPVDLPVDNLLDKVTQAVITPFTSAIQPLVQSSAFNSLISILAFVLLFGLLIFIITKVRGG